MINHSFILLLSFNCFAVYRNIKCKYYSSVTFVFLTTLTVGLPLFTHEVKFK